MASDRSHGKEQLAEVREIESSGTRFPESQHSRLHNLLLTGIERRILLPRQRGRVVTSLETILTASSSSQVPLLNLTADEVCFSFTDSRGAYGVRASDY